MSDDKVWLVVGPDYDHGELISRMRLPDDALRSALGVKGAVLAETFEVEGAEDREYEVWTVER